MMRRLQLIVLVGALMWAAEPVKAANSFQQRNLVADVSGMGAQHVDPNLKNPWGIAFSGNNPFWVSNNNSGTSTLYDVNGNQQGTFTVDRFPGDPNSFSTPTGIVANNGGFGGSVFIFSTEDGTINAWTGASNIPVVVNNSASSAVYKGLAQASTGVGTFIYATNFRSGRVDVFDTNFNPVQPSGGFTDPNLPVGFAPFGIQNIGNNQLIVTYAMQDSAKHDPIKNGGGAVDVFDANGTLLQRIAANDGHLQAPWGVALAPAAFPQFGGMLLIGNFGNGWINVYNMSTHAFVDTVRDPKDNIIAIDGLWALVFHPDTGNDPNTIFFTAGPNSESDGLFGTIKAAAASGGTSPDFALMANPTTAVVMPNQSVMFNITVSAVNGFNNSVSLTCTAPAGTSCSLNPTTVSPGQSSTLTVRGNGMVGMQMGRVNSIRGSRPPLAVLLLLSAPGLMLLVPAAYNHRRGNKLKVSAIFATVLALATLLTLVGCGSGSMNAGSSNRTAQAGTLTVTATSGQLTHTTTVTLTVY